METPKEHCGVFGIYSYSGANVTPITIKGLMGLQNRGQESWGISVDGVIYKRPGLVYYGYKEGKEAIDKIAGHSGIGHVRYSTVGSSANPENFHPMEISSSGMKIRIAHNGTISNTNEMKNLLRDGGIKTRDAATDTELSGHLLAKFFSEKGDWASAFKCFDEAKNGSYCFVIQTESGEIVAARDSRGYKPLCYGYHAETDSFIVASESFALDKVGAKKLDDVEPGQLVIFGDSGFKSGRFADAKERALDPFELTYFAHPASNIDGKLVMTARKEMGKELYRKFGLGGDVIIPVPESAVHAAEGYSQSSGIELVHAMGKDRYTRKSVLRGFIQPDARGEIAESMYVIREAVDGKRVIVIDDSIVRGTSSAAFINLLKQAGARYIALLSTFPPIRYPCYMGNDFPTQKELIAHAVAENDEIEAVGAKVAKELKIDFVGYMDPSSISRAIGMPVNSLCFSCVDGDYGKLNFAPQLKSRSEMKGPEGIQLRS